MTHEEIMINSRSLEDAIALIEFHQNNGRLPCKLYDQEARNWWTDGNGSTTFEAAGIRTVQEAVDKLSSPIPGYHGAGNGWPTSRIYLLTEQPVEEVLTATQARDMQIQLGNRNCLIRVTEGNSAGRYYLRPNSGTTSDRAEAHVYTLEEAIRMANYGTDYGTDELVLIPTEPQLPAPASPYIRLTRQQCMDSLDELDRKLCYIVISQGPSVGNYWRKPSGSGNTPDIGPGNRFSVREALTTTPSDGILYQLVDQELAARIASQKCNAVKTLGRPLVDLLMIAPLNPTARAKVMAIIGQMPAPELDTWDKIKQWIETTHKPKTDGVAWQSPEQAGGLPQGFNISVDFSEMQNGTCRYRVAASTRVNFSVTPDMMTEAIGICTSLDELKQKLRGIILEEPWSVLNPECEGDEDEYEYDSYSHIDSRNHNADIDNGHLQRQIVTWMRRTQPPEVLTRFRITP